MDASYYFSTYLAKVSPSTLAKIYLCCKDIDLNFGFEVVCFSDCVDFIELVRESTYWAWFLSDWRQGRTFYLLRV